MKMWAQRAGNVISSWHQVDGDTHIDTLCQQSCTAWSLPAEHIKQTRAHTDTHTPLTCLGAGGGCHLKVTQIQAHSLHATALVLSSSTAQRLRAFRKYAEETHLSRSQRGVQLMLLVCIACYCAIHNA